MKFIWILTVIACSLSGLLGYKLHGMPPDTMKDKIWIEFSSAQHALDASARLGGQARGLTVCMGDPVWKSAGTWMPPGTSITGNREDCPVKPRNAPLAMLEVSANNTGSSLTFNASYRGATVYNNNNAYIDITGR